METDALRTLWTECFGNEEDWIDGFFRTAFDPAHVCCLTRRGRLAAALCWMDAACEGRKLAYLYAIATAPAHLRQGLCRELMGKTHELLAQQGYAGAVLVPGDEGLRQRLSLEKLVRPDMPPVFLWHTRDDGSVPCRNSLILAQAMDDAGVDFALHVYRHGPHGLSTADAMAYPAQAVPEVSWDVPGWVPAAIRFFGEIGLKMTDGGTES